MRRLVLVFMMMLLPLQWSWAAAASVCQHEANGAHFGHHEHKRDNCSQADVPDTAEKSDQNSDDPSLGKHPDCQVCHGVGVAHVPMVAVITPAWVPDRQVPDYGRHVPEPPLESFLRPPLNLVA